jgi:tetratricopeptide (TPR) repeat protein
MVAKRMETDRKRSAEATGRGGRFRILWFLNLTWIACGSPFGDGLGSSEPKGEVPDPFFLHLHRTFFNAYNRRIIGMLFLFGFWMAQAGCMQKISIVPSASSPIPPVQPEEQVKAPEQPSPCMMASMQLTEQGRILLEKGRSDDAIRVLERAISIDSSNGRNYFYMSEAWLYNGNRKQAKEFNRLSQVYLMDDPEWRSRVIQQRDRIQRLQK